MLPALRLRPACPAEVQEQPSRQGTHLGLSRFNSARDKTDELTVRMDWFTSIISDCRLGILIG
jgi:hypothetical protein